LASAPWAISCGAWAEVEPVRVGLEVEARRGLEEGWYDVVVS
jgi:hypothetical protein